MSGRSRRGGVEVPTKEGYDRWSRVYDSDGNPLLALEEPVVRRLLGPVRGRAVADIGCGTGRHALALARAGAKGTAVDEVLPKSHPQTLSDYVVAAARAGLRVEAMEEHAATAALARRCPRARKYVGWPMLVAMRLARVRSRRTGPGTAS
ncbi:MAG: class I SAM-dependent methyltransferase [Elusimicrobia bacterium]|nr:class I SAM-dependent methyltransferase [Elusimicrobiota bacterium]